MLQPYHGLTPCMNLASSPTALTTPRAPHVLNRFPFVMDMHPVATQGQIFLDSFNPILENAIKPRLLDGRREPCELKVSDFDDAMYTLEVRMVVLETGFQRCTKTNM